MTLLSLLQRALLVARQKNLWNFTQRKPQARPTSMSTGTERLRITQRASRTKGYAIFLIFQPKQQNLIYLSALKQQYLKSMLNQMPQTPFTGGFSQLSSAWTARVMAVTMAPLTMKRVARTMVENLSSSLGRKVWKLKMTMVRKKRELMQKLPVTMVHRKRLPRVVGTLLAMTAEGMLVKRSTSQQPISEKQSRRVKKGILPIYYWQFISPSFDWLFALIIISY